MNVEHHHHETVIHHYHHDDSSSSSSSSSEEEGERAGAFAAGGLVIINNPADTAVIENSENLQDEVKEGFYEEQKEADPEDFDIEEVAEAATADTDLVGEDPAELL